VSIADGVVPGQEALLSEKEWPLKGLLDIPGWSGLGICGRLYQVARDLDVDGANVEIGCYFGRTSVAICRGLFDSKAGGFLVSIDPFEVPPGEEALGSHMNLFPKPWHETMLKYVEDAGVKNRMFVLARSESPIARTSVSGPVRFAFIDGDHRYEQVKADIEWLLPLMADGGVMALDDMHCNIPRWGVTQAYEEVLKPRVRKVLFGDTGACQFFEVLA
jgi:hypothetical protein